MRLDEPRDPNPIAGCISPTEEIRLIADELGIDIPDLVAKRRAKLMEQAAEKEKLQAERNAAAAAAKRAKYRANFEQFIRDQHVIALFDGQPVKVVPFCKDGDLSDTDTQKLCDIVAGSRTRLINGRHGESPGTIRAAEASIQCGCSCGKTHHIRVFISGE